MADVNLVRYSNLLTNPIYSLENVGVADATPSITTSPTGKATRLVSYGNADGTTLQWFRQNSIPEYVPNTQFTASLIFKNETWNENFTFELFGSDDSGIASGITAYTNLLEEPQSMVPTGTTTWSTFSSSMMSLANGWYQATISAVSPPTVGLTLSLGITMGNSPAPVGNSLLLGGLTLYQGSDNRFIATTTTPLGSNFLPIFSFMKHRTATRYPQNGTTIQFGGGYIFSAKPSAPPQRIFILDFDVMKWYINSDGTLDPYTDADINIGALDAFYNLVQTYAPFTYVHPSYGPLTVKFFKPLEIPPGEKGGTGSVFNIQLELVEQV